MATIHPYFDTPCPSQRLKMHLMNTWACTCLSTWRIPCQWNPIDGAHQMGWEEKAILISHEQGFSEVIVNSNLLAIFWIAKIFETRCVNPTSLLPWAHEDAINTCSICVPNPTLCDLLLLSLCNLCVYLKTSLTVEFYMQIPWTTICKLQVVIKPFLLWKRDGAICLPHMS